LGIMHINENVPMSTKRFYHSMDEIVEAKNSYSTYISSKEIFNKSTDYFKLSYTDFSKLKKDRLLDLLPLYQIWRHKDLYAFEEINTWPVKLKNMIFPNMEKNSI